MQQHIVELIILLSVIGKSFSNDADQLLVTTKYGQVHGTILTPENSPQTCHGFIGVPFAKPPIGDLRFEKPRDPEPWSDVLEAHQACARCMQLPGAFSFPGPEHVNDSEDCLYLNIVRPPSTETISEQQKYPVMVWIHGGAFVMESSFEYEPPEICRNLVSRDVIVVTIQYRIGVFGFLATGDDSAPGNYGLHDQIQALKWVHENIANFGGDPSQVTIFGESAGGASVSLLNYFSRAQPYYSRAIAQSGSALAYWVLNTRSIDSFHMLSSALGCGDKSTKNKKKLDCIKQTSVEEINNAHLQVFEAKMLPGKKKKPGRTYLGGGHGISSMYVRWAPTIDRDLIPTGGIAALKPSGKPIITGTTEQEIFEFVLPSPEIKELFDEGDDGSEAPLQIDDIQDFVYSTMEENLQEAIFIAKNPWKGQQFDNDKAHMGPLESAAEFAYVTALGDRNNKTILVRQTVQLGSDTMFNAPCILDAENNKRAGAPVWVYSFDHYRPVDVPGDRPWKAASHAADLPMLFTRLSVYMSDVFDEQDNMVRDLTCKLWTDFAKHGHPSEDVQWPQYESLDNPVHLKIKAVPEVSSNYHRPTVPFWTTLFPRITKQKDSKEKKNKHQEL